MNNNETLSTYLKVRDFLNNEENGLIVRISIILLGTLFSSVLLISSLLFNNSVGVAFQIFAYLTFILSWLSVAVWYFNEN